MSTNNRTSSIPNRKYILVLSASQYLSGHPISEVIRTDWTKDKARKIAAEFDNVGFDIDPTADTASTLESLQRVLQARWWDGVIIGWCVRSHVEFTVLFEQIVRTVAGQVLVQPGLKIMFCAGPEDLVQTTLRNCPSE
ncbi:hypothetical protein BGW36DRAFT_428598 [Talaromyces proteolyticus]|uniref:Uncharacterized protein n=1 Tax=Talaromyces proteolyticus TaxID=1131652 RepID=A0AAD4KU40_9EURO|nr:uncharacterized protein BGW36DRAFT_428598 [Talaromyces proteolyticus]KAH8696596.1 hypothetical protein BGW36DRAFT_428598 [Talaromyces proteolyticus]